jgi:hypothetical protein
MSGYKEQLNQLAASDRRQLIFGIVVVAGILIAFAAMFFVEYFPGEIREVTGAIVSFKTEARDDAVPPIHYVYVRLDDGRTVRAKVSGHIALKIGRRATLFATKMPVLGLERYRFKAFLDDRNDLEQRFQDLLK